MVSSELLAAAATEPSTQKLAAFVATIPPVDDDAVAREVAAAIATAHNTEQLRSFIDIAIGLIDLTTLEGSDTPAKVAALAQRALTPDPSDPSTPHTAAVCVYGDRAADVRAVLGTGSPVQLACVAGAFPSGRADIDVKLADVRYALSQGATEIDMVIDRGAFLDGDYAKVFDDVARIVAVAHAEPHRATVKVILENGELGGSTAVRQASWLALIAGADFIKTSTGKIAGVATLADVAVMLHVAEEFERLTGRPVGVKAAGGIRTARDAVNYLSLVTAIVGHGWLTPARFRFGASGVLADVVRARQALQAGRDPFGGEGVAAGQY